MSTGLIHVGQNKRIRSFSIDKAGLRGLLETLQERVSAAAEIEKHNLPKRPEHTDEEHERALKDLDEGFELFLTLSGSDGRKLSGSIAEVIKSQR